MLTVLLEYIDLYAQGDGSLFYLHFPWRFLLLCATGRLLLYIIRLFAYHVCFLVVFATLSHRIMLLWIF